MFISVGPSEGVFVEILNLRDERVVSFPVVEGKGLVGVVVFPRASFVPLDWLFVPSSKLTSYLSFFCEIDFESGSIKR